MEILKIEFLKIRKIALKELGLQYYIVKNWEKALNCFDDFLKTSKDSDISIKRHTILLELGNQSLNQKDYLNAKDYYNKILMDDEENFYAILGKALSQNGISEYQNALNNFNILIIKTT